MNIGRLVGGIVCLALATLLGVLSVTLPTGEVIFTVDGQNMPWLPAGVLGVAGIALVATAGIGRQRSVTREGRAHLALDPGKAALNQRLEMVGWGCFLIMLGGFILVPHTVVARGFWSIGVGLIMLGLNVMRYLNGIKMSGFTTFLGIISLSGGVLQLVGLQSIEGAFLLIILGTFLLLRPWFDKRQIFGKAEEA